jgi:hypothetical protein
MAEHGPRNLIEFRRSPEIRLAKVQQRKTALERRLASAERIPDVSLSLFALRTVNFSSVLPHSVSSVGLQATWDDFDGGENDRRSKPGRTPRRRWRPDGVSIRALPVRRRQ